MGWFGKITFGSLGLFLGGPLGAIAGAALGHHLVDKKNYDINNRFQKGQPSPFGQREQVQAAYFVSMFSILGKLSKIDGVVTKKEINVVESFINSLPISEGEKQFADVVKVRRMYTRPLALLEPDDGGQDNQRSQSDKKSFDKVICAKER